MHRRPILALLDAYAARHPGEADVAARITALVQAHADCFERTCVPGHVTGSAWVLSADRRRCLLTLHGKLGRWLQLGGHSDGDSQTHRVALREAQEESGMTRLAFLDARGERVPEGAVPEPFDLDVHLIPARGDEPEHEHHDLRYLLVAEPDQELVCSDESADLAWFAPDEVERLPTDESVLRQLRKARAVLAGVDQVG